MCPIGSGNWNNSSNAGVWALNLTNNFGNANNNYGFRSDSGSPRTLKREGGTKGDVFRRLGAKSEGIGLAGRAVRRFEGQAA